MPTDNNERPNNPGGETLNDRLRRAAAMSRQEQQQHPEPVSPYAHKEEPKVDPVEPADEPQQRHAHRNPEEEFTTVEVKPDNGAKSPKKLIIVLVALLLLAVLAIVFLSVSNKVQVAEQQEQIEQLQLANEQIQLANEYDALNNEFAQYENQTSLLANDSIVQKYSAARAQVEKLLQELKNEKSKSAAQISKLKGEIETLKGILRNYVEQINELNQENQELRTENQEVKAKNQQLSQNIQTVQANNKVLNERMTLAEKLNVTGVNLVALNKKGKTEKNVTKARQLMVTFTIPQNNSTPVGEKVVWCRITNPEGDLLGGGGSFSFEGSTLQASARKSVEYAGEEIGGIAIYWDVNTTLNPGDYTVELFCDNYRLTSRKFTLKK
jgi:myosin heavy subunit